MSKETELLSWEEFMKIKKRFDAEPTIIACPECGKRIYERTNIVLATYPPVHAYFCECGWADYA